MPIRVEYRRFYGREWREIVRPRILARAQHCCERCGKPNGATVLTLDKGKWFDPERDVWRMPASLLVDLRHPRDRGLLWARTLLAAEARVARPVRVKIGVAHLNRTPGDDRDENLAAWCQRCHLVYDAKAHAEAAAATRVECKDRARPLFRDLWA